MLGLQGQLRRLISRIDDLVQGKLDAANEILLAQVLLVLFVVHVVRFDYELLRLLKEVVHVELLDEVRVRVVPDGLGATQALLDRVAASRVQSVEHDEAVRLGADVHLGHVSERQRKLNSLLQLVARSHAYIVLQGLQSRIVDVGCATTARHCLVKTLLALAFSRRARLEYSTHIYVAK